MQENSLLELVHKIQQFGCDFQTVEVKPAEKSYPSRLLTTLSSFSNQDEGGIILFGLSEEHGWMVVGVYDVHDLQQRVTAQCNEMSPAVKPLFTVIEIEGKYVVSAEIPGLDVAKRPVYYKGQGRSNGSYIRVGDADEPAAEEEIYSYEAYRSRIKDDIRQIPETKVSMLRPEAVQRYLESIKKERPNVATYATDDEILELMGIIEDGRPTLAGMVVFGKYPQGLFPQLALCGSLEIPKMIASISLFWS